MDLRPAIIFMPQAEPTVAKPTVGKPVVKVDGTRMKPSWPRTLVSVFIPCLG